MSQDNHSRNIAATTVNVGMNQTDDSNHLDTNEEICHHPPNNQIHNVTNGKSIDAYINEGNPKKIYSSLVDSTSYEYLLSIDEYLNTLGTVIYKPSDNNSCMLDETDVKLRDIVYTDPSSSFDFSKVGKYRYPIKSILDDDDDISNCIQKNDLDQLLQVYKLYHNNNNRQLKNTTQQCDEYFQNFSVGILKNNDTYNEPKLTTIPNRISPKHNKDTRVSILQKKAVSTSTVLNNIGNTQSHTATYSSSSYGSNNLLLSRDKIVDTEFIPEIGRKRRKRQFMSSDGLFLLKVDSDSPRFRYYYDFIIKEIGKVFRQRNSQRVLFLNTKRKLMNNITKKQRKAYSNSKKKERECIARAKRTFKEVYNYGRKSVKSTSSNKKKHEKQLVEKQKQQQQYNEMKRQQRKLNYLITQTELFSHFMGLKNQQQNASSNENEEELVKILSILDEGEDARKDIQSAMINNNIISKDNYDVDQAKNAAIEETRKAVEKQSSKLDQFQQQFPNYNVIPANNKCHITIDDYFMRENKLFVGTLKSYQLKGVAWLAGLYDKGINGILADEMGLGKTVQTMSFLAYLSEVRNLWGPFLIISPSSTLHNWQQEFTKFVPEFNVLPYWGNSTDRKSLRTFWNAKKHLFQSRKTAPFHVLITSYQLVIRDYQYFKRISWQYMVLDEAQAIKSVNSQRWKTLLSFNCRNRILLTGTPMQNTMAELWALLHFIMPVLFDSHDEFNEWFSKDIEGHVENKTTVDQTHLSRLHMILKPFMLRRTKKEVEKELTEKIEIQIKCGLSIRQKMLYEILKKKLSNDEIRSHLEQNLGSVSSTGSNTSVLNNINQLMNLVVQFRKVCNHPDLFEKRNLITPLHLEPLKVPLPNSFLSGEFLPTSSAKLSQLFNIYSPENVTQQMFTKNSQYGFVYFSKIHPSTCYQLMSHIHSRIKYYMYQLEHYKTILYRNQSCYDDSQENDIVKSKLTASPLINLMIWPSFKLSAIKLSTEFENILKMFIFVDNSKCFQKFGTAKIGKIINTNDETKLIPRMDGMNGKPTIELLNNTKNDNFFTVIESIHSYPDIVINASHDKVITSIPKINMLSKRALVHNNFKNNINRLYENFIISGECERLPNNEVIYKNDWSYNPIMGFNAITPPQGWSRILKPDPSQLIGDSGKMLVLHSLLTRLKVEGHRVLIYSQMTKMIDILEIYLNRCRYKFVRLDGSSKMADRRETVADFQSNPDIFVFLLSTRAGGVGINLTAADTVIFYDSDWNPTVDQQAMDRAHRLGQTRQVTVYRLICDGTVEERILQRAQQKSMVQQMIISGKNKQEALKPKEIMALLLGEEDIQHRLRSRKESSYNSDKRKSRKRNAPIDPQITKSVRKKSLSSNKNMPPQVKPFNTSVTNNAPIYKFNNCKNNTSHNDHGDDKVLKH